MEREFPESSTHFSLPPVSVSTTTYNDTIAQIPVRTLYFSLIEKNVSTQIILFFPFHFFLYIFKFSDGK